MENIKRNVDFLYEIGTLRYVPRSWVQFLNKDFANVSEHTFRVMWIAILIATEEHADVGKVAKMALVHDLTETRTPEVHYLSRLYGTRDNDNAIRDTLRGTSMEIEFLSYAFEYEKRETIESKIVKDADNLDVDLELKEQYANGKLLLESFQVMRSRVHELLYTNTAKELWKAIHASNPHDWHVYGKNRYNEGDWKR